MSQHNNNISFRNRRDSSNPKCHKVKKSCPKSQIKKSFNTNRQLKVPKIIKQKEHQPSLEEIIQMSIEEQKLTEKIQNEISNKEYLHEILSELKGVDPNDPMFNQFYNKV